MKNKEFDLKPTAKAFYEIYNEVTERIYMFAKEHNNKEIDKCEDTLTELSIGAYNIKIHEE